MTEKFVEWIGLLDRRMSSRKLSELKPHPQNPQEHPQEQIDELKANIRRNGLNRCFKIRPDGTVLIGHATRLALLELAKEEFAEAEEADVPVLVYAVDDSEAKRIMLSDNLLGDMADRHADRILDLATELLDSDEGLEGTGLTEGRLDDLRAEARPRMAAGDDDEDDKPDFQHECPECGYTW